jgi:serine/threonine-protein kinase
VSARRRWSPEPGAELVPGWTALEHLGGGRRTEAWRCADDDRLAVVKLLRPGRDHDRDRRRLEEEVRAYDAATHPVFPRLLATGLDHDPPWIALEHVDGQPLSRLVRDSGPLDLDQALPLLRTLAAALADLHGHDRVHLDVKPSNVVLATTPRLLDLGASRTLADAAALGPGIGTWHAMAPEQREPGRFGPVGPAADVWGIGSTLLYAITGSTPLRRRRDEPTPDEADVAAAARAAVRQAPRTVRDLLAACLATAPGERPAADELAGAAAATAPPPGVVSRLGAILRGRA